LCRRSRAAAYGSVLLTSPQELRWTHGYDHVRSYRLPHRHTYTAAFCELCGSPVPIVIADPHLVLLPVGAINTPLPLLPIVHLYVASRASWHEITDDGPQFDELPPRERYDELFA
jgi:hypothetical protein